PSIIWDRIQVQGYSVSDSRADVGDEVSIDVTLVYDYDDSPVTSGTVTIAGPRGDTQPSIKWYKIIGNQYHEYSRVLEVNDGGYILLANGSSLVYLDSAGNEEWNNKLGGQLRSIQETSDGGYIATGSKSGDVYLVKTDSKGGRSGALLSAAPEVRWVIRFRRLATEDT
ncbi:MAG: hypothetical protein QGF78_07125, partial [Candidatus Bathyarchaeota archaeon]|nr:hypothetical protein [Candidatus Bathyarchaeota archaeon]